MKKTLIATVFLAMLTAGAMAQRPSQEEMQARRAEMVNKQAEKLAKDFDLKGDAKNTFIADYKAFQSELQAVQQADGQRGERAEESKKLTEEQATKQLEEYFSRQEQQAARQLQRLAVEKEYYAKFKAVLTPQQLLKVFTQRQGGGQQRGGYRPQGGQGRGPRGGGFGGSPEGGFGGDF